MSDTCDSVHVLFLLSTNVLCISSVLKKVLCFVIFFIFAVVVVVVAVVLVVLFIFDVYNT